MISPTPSLFDPQLELETSKNSSEISSEISSEEFTLEVTEAAELLGVSRTRLSQLTSKGVFSFERRKLDTRNRLFYSKEVLLRYLRGQQVRIAGASAEPHQVRWTAVQGKAQNKEMQQ